MLIEGNVIPEIRSRDLLREANELLAIFVTSQMTAKGIRSNSSIRQSGNS